jgi:superfamily II DNA or RNA helicase
MEATHDAPEPSLQALKSYYRTGRDNLGTEFFARCLEHCYSYKRAAGYFSSSALKTWSSTLVRLIADKVHIFLLISPELSEEDAEALKQATTEESRLQILATMGERLIEEVFAFAQTPDDASKRIALMAWMIASGQLEIRFALPRHIDDAGMFHEKSGIFAFPSAVKVGFVGSANETYSGHVRNYEKVVVFRSWLAEDATRVVEVERDFDDQWSGKDEDLLISPLSESSLALIRTRAPAERPHLGTSFPTTFPTQKQVVNDRRWRHQEEALKKFLESKAGILEMATGTGKTNTALKIAKVLLDDGLVRSIIVSTEGTDLLDQWFRTIVTWETAEAKGLRVLRHYGEHHQSQTFALRPLDAALIVSRQQLRAVLSQLDPKVQAQTLIVHDEVHGFGAPQCIRDLKGLQKQFAYRLGLSATPEREYDAIGSAFVEEEIGPVVYSFGLRDAIERGILVEFNYVPISYQLTDEDKKRLSMVYSKKALRQKEGNPMSKEEVWTELARVYKTAEQKPMLFANYLHEHSEALNGAIIFVEERWYGDQLLPTLHQYTNKYRTYYAEDDRDNLLKFGRGEIDCLVTCHRISQGIDIRALRTVAILSSARARLETIQRIGRCLRVDPSNPAKRALVIDFVRDESNRVPGEADFETSDAGRRQWLSELATAKRKE